MSKKGEKGVKHGKCDMPKGYVELDPDKSLVIGDYKEGDYADADRIPFNELLQTHHKQVVWGFKFGEEIRKRAQENMRLARDKSAQEKRKIDEVSESPVSSHHNEETNVDIEQPCSSKSMVEVNHKTPHSHKRQKARRRSKRVLTMDCTLETTRKTPLPLLNWADSREVWSYMVYKEEASLTLRNPRLFEDFSNLLPRMRAILLDWIMEVCEVYHLRRVTYYLSVDYFDRFLSIRPDVPKNQLQLVGVTCLFLASKLEEVYPPKLTEFSYVCDGACSPDEILACELLILNSLGWDLNLMTPSDWLNLYMQIHFKADFVTRQRLHADINKNFLFPQYSGYQFTRASQMIDLCSLDPGFLRFSYSTIAAAAMYFMYGKRAALSVSGLTWDQLRDCAEYMAVFYQIVRDSHDPKLRSCTHDPNSEDPERNLNSMRSNIGKQVTEENHSIQTHVVNMEYFEKAVIARLEQMGFKIEKTYVNKISNDAEQESEEKTLYEIEKIYNEESGIIEEYDNENNQSISYINSEITGSEKKALVTLDNLLLDIVKCEDDSLPPSGNSEEEC